MNHEVVELVIKTLVNEYESFYHIHNYPVLEVQDNLRSCIFLIKHEILI